MLGGISTVCRKKHLIANNEYMQIPPCDMFPNGYSLYDPSKPKNYIMYLDVTNLYGHSMIQELPTSDFQFVPLETYYLNNIDQLFLDAQIYNWGYILEVDLDYPRHLHDLHIDFPFAPEHYNSKLCPTLFDKKNYKIHYLHLKLCLENGLILSKIHKILKFKKLAWLKPYIEMNTEIRKNTTNASEKEQAKLMNNAIFGKSMENILGIKNI